MCYVFFQVGFSGGQQGSKHEFKTECDALNFVLKKKEIVFLVSKGTENLNI